MTEPSLLKFDVGRCQLCESSCKRLPPLKTGQENCVETFNPRSVPAPTMRLSVWLMLKPITLIFHPPSVKADALWFQTKQPGLT